MGKPGGPYQQRRGELTIRSAECYVPKRRKWRHHQDSFSVALLLSKDLPDVGRQFAADCAPLVAALVPPVCDVLCCPPQSRARARKGNWYFARELVIATAAILGLPVGGGEGPGRQESCRAVGAGQEAGGGGGVPGP